MEVSRYPGEISMLGGRMGTMRFRVIIGVVAAAVITGGILLGLNLGGSDSPAVRPASAAAQGSNGAGAGTDRSGGGSGSATSSASGSAGSKSGGSGSTAGGTTTTSSNSSTSSTSTTLGPHRVPVICTVVLGRTSGTISLSSCSQVLVTGGSGTFPGALLARSGSGTITWHGTGTTSFVYTVSHPASQRRKCPVHGTEATLRGSVTTNSPKGARNFGVKGPLRVKLCIDAFSRVRLLGGHSFQF
jgi:hypothetical protein